MSLSGHQGERMKDDEWLTPPEIIFALGTFDLDPCSTMNRPWPTAARHYTEHDNGLELPWHGRVWCNPPFGRDAPAWLARMAEHGNGVVLIPARAELYDSVWGSADGVLFVQDRPRFHYSDGTHARRFNGGVLIALVAYGRENLDALFNSRLGGSIVVRNNTGGKPHERA